MTEQAAQRPPAGWSWTHLVRRGLEPRGNQRTASPTGTRVADGSLRNPFQKDHSTQRSGGLVKEKNGRGKGQESHPNCACCHRKTSERVSTVSLDSEIVLPPALRQTGFGSQKSVTPQKGTSAPSLTH